MAVLKLPSVLFESYGHGKAAGHFTVRLRFRRACADGYPRKQVGDILGDNGIEHLAGGGHAEFGEFKQKGTRLEKPLFNIIAYRSYPGR